MSAARRTKLRRFDFYPDDWLAGTIGLDPAERGIYITALAAMWAHGGPIKADELRRLCPCDLRLYKRAVNRLLVLGKLDLKGGYLSNNRFLKDLQLARKRLLSAAQNGRKGGRPRKETNELAKPNKKRSAPSPSPSPSPESKTRASHETRARRSDFSEWWEAYPHKVGKGAAEKAYRDAEAEADPAELLAGAQRYAASKPPDRQWCNPAKWLAETRWEDQPAEPPVTNGHDGHRQRDGPKEPPPPLNWRELPEYQQ